MPAEDMLRAGHLAEAIADVKAQVRKQPEKVPLRIFLFQLMAVDGDWERALTQLGVIGELDVAAMPMVQTYREALACEAVRSDVFSGKRAPLVFGEPDRWVALMLEALGRTASGDHEAASKLRDEAFTLAPGVAGAANGDRFEWIADADVRLGPILEVILNGRYYWVPLHRVHRVTIDAPADLRDFVWMPATFTWANGGEAVGLIPTRYPGSEADDDPLVRLARKTLWREPAPGTYVGAGQRVLATDAGDYALMDLRTIEFDSLPPTAAEEAPAVPPAHG